MSIRLKCPACQASFMASDDRLGQKVKCPKCGAEQTAPNRASPPSAPDPDAEPTWVANDEPAPARRRSGLKWIVGAFVILLPVAAVSVLVAWPRLKEWWDPQPKTEAARAAKVYLQALVEGDQAKIQALGTVEEPPAIRSYQTPQQVKRTRLKGSFAPIGKFHAAIAEKYEYDPKSGRFELKNTLGPLAETADMLKDAKDKGEGQRIADKINSGSPDDLFDAAESLGAVYSKLAEGLTKVRLAPTYAQLVKEAKPKLPTNEELLALDYGEHMPSWDALLKRPFLTLRADGPFVLDRAEVTALVRDKLASAGDPPVTLRLTLHRFRLEGIDTGWKVIAARRDVPGEPAPSQPSGSTPPPYPERRSPGDVP